MTDLRWAFFDHATIEGLGLGSAINIPVVYDGATIGIMNVLDVEHGYAQTHVDALLPLAPILIPAFLQACRHA